MLNGLLLGLSIAAPVGPIGLLCIRRTLAHGRLTGFISGLGAASADGLYGAVAAFGLATLADIPPILHTVLGLFGGLFLLYLGVKTFRARPAETTAEARDARSLLGVYASTFALTITNPMTIGAFIGFFVGAGVSVGSSSGEAALLVLGVFCGSALWWLLLSGGVSLLRERFTPTTLRWVNWAAGLVIMAFGAAAVLSVITAGA